MFFAIALLHAALCGVALEKVCSIIFPGVLMIRRTHYLNQPAPFADSDLVKVVTGIRRCGKSIILKQLAEQISEKTDNIIFLEFE